MNKPFAYTIALGIGALLALPANADPVYNNLTPNNSMAIATRPSTTGQFEIEAGDDFVLRSQTHINSAKFVGLAVPGSSGTFSVSDLVVEMYRVFPLDSNTVRLPQVPTRNNSPSDVAFASKDSGGGELTFSTAILSGTFTALNSVQAGGIHPSPGQTTLGNGPLTGQEVEFTVNFTSPFDLPSDHYFFVPQVSLSNGAQFYWLSASRPISGVGTTPFAPDLQAWTRDQFLSPDWLRVGTDIVGGTPAPTFNAAFSLDGTAVPEPGSTALFIAGVALIGVGRFARRSWRSLSGSRRE
jgi:hypothetical protein